MCGERDTTQRSFGTRTIKEQRLRISPLNVFFSLCPCKKTCSVKNDLFPISDSTLETTKTPKKNKQTAETSTRHTGDTGASVALRLDTGMALQM